MILLSILDNDLYKFSMSYVYMTKYPESEGTFVFQDRDNTVFDEKFLDELRMELANFSHLKMREDEFKWLTVEKGIPYIPAHYWEWLKGFTFDHNKIKTWLDEEGHLHITVTDSMYKVTLYEVPILAIVGELRNKHFGYYANERRLLDILDDKIAYANAHGLKFSEFGTRRRYSSATHNSIVRHLKEKCPVCVGTSNVYLAYKYRMKPIGTAAHEITMFHAAIGGYKKANQRTMEAWQDVYHGQLGIALLDTFTTPVFLREFSRELAKLFDGVRQDSGDEIKIGNMVIDRYRELGIDPTSKTIIFSNALDMEKYAEIARYFNGRINVSAGIGGNIVNDPGLENYKRPNMVMKLMECRMSPREEFQKCVKISDDLGKHMGDSKEVEVAKYQLRIPEQWTQLLNFNKINGSAVVIETLADPFVAYRHCDSDVRWRLSHSALDISRPFDIDSFLPRDWLRSER